MNSISELFGQKGVVMIPKKELDRLEKVERDFEKAIKEKEKEIADLKEKSRKELETIAKRLEFTVEIDGYKYKTNDHLIVNLRKELRMLETNFLDKDKQANKYYKDLKYYTECVLNAKSILENYLKLSWWKRIINKAELQLALKWLSIK